MKKTIALVISCLSFFLFTSCSSRTENAFEMLQGLLAWMNKDYQNAVVSFVSVTEKARRAGDTGTEAYAQYALAVTYLAQNETNAALIRLGQIPADAPSDVRFGALYNSGIIAWNTGTYDEAALCFREALKLAPADMNAKINLELSLQMTEMSAAAESSGMMPATETNNFNSVADSLFSIIKAGEQNRWKNQENTEDHSNILDY